MIKLLNLGTTRGEINPFAIFLDGTITHAGVKATKDGVPKKPQNESSIMRNILLAAVATIALGANAAYAELTTEQLIDMFPGAAKIEIARGAATTSVEVFVGNEKIEVVFDNVTDAELSRESTTLTDEELAQALAEGGEGSGDDEGDVEDGSEEEAEDEEEDEANDDVDGGESEQDDEGAED